MNVAGEAPPYARREATLEGRRSIPKVPLVIFDPVPSEKHEELLLEGSRPVMFSLVLDILDHFRDMGLADGECTKTVLPREPRIWGNVSGSISTSLL